jgi:hypothetical protein
MYCPFAQCIPSFDQKPQIPQIEGIPYRDCVDGFLPQVAFALLPACR